MPNPNPNTSGLKPPFPKGTSGNPKGRPPSRVPEALKNILGRKKAKKFYRLNESEVNEWEASILTMTTNELKALASWEDANSYAKGLAMGILFDMKNGNTKTIDKLRERQFGKAVQKVELTGKDGADLVPARVLSKLEAKELLESLNNEF
jgi:hypothetical protein